MIELEENSKTLETIHKKLQIWVNLFDISKAENELKDLENQTLKEHFWENSDNSAKVLAQIKRLKSKYLSFKVLKQKFKI